MTEPEVPLLANFVGRLPRAAPIVALLDFPRRDRVEIARGLGVSAVLGKPWRLDDLLAVLAADRHAEQPEQGAHAA